MKELASPELLMTVLSQVGPLLHQGLQGDKGISYNTWLARMDFDPEFNAAATEFSMRITTEILDSFNVEEINKLIRSHNLIMGEDEP